jgi:hypothetical protein
MPMVVTAIEMSTMIGVVPLRPQMYMPPLTPMIWPVM